MRESIVKIVKKLCDGLAEAVFPAVCECCGSSLVNGEDMLCLQCLHSLPRTNYHRDQFGELHKRIAAPGLPIERTAAMFHYIKESRYASLIQHAKYNNRPSIARKLAKMYASELKAEGFFDDIDIILPIPLHRIKLLRRGFNQSESIAAGINDATGIKYGDNLRALPHSTQTRKNAVERAANMEGTIIVRQAEELHEKHVLIVDDVVTTGATLLAAAKAIKKVSPTTRISILTLAASKLA